MISSAFPYYEFQITWAHELGVGLRWSGTVVITLGMFALAITLLQEYLDREKEPPSKRT